VSNGDAPAAGPRVRRDVQSLIAEGDSGLAVLADYADAVRSMRALDPGPGPPDPGAPHSWRFQAAIHGLAGLPRTVDHPLGWAGCRHNSWFFLPWHRVYLYFFERIVQSHLGDPTWSLPYWDYTKRDDPGSRILPQPFRTPTTGNELHTDRRDRRVNHPTAPVGIPREDADAMPALRDPDFALAPEDASSTFGGGIFDDAVPVHDALGLLEGTPHGLVHGDVGGWMSAFETAALDPIFWLHHANIDRLWDVWLGVWGRDALPADPAWLDTEFAFFDGDGTRASMTIRDVIESASLGYVYESTAPPAPIPAIAVPEEAIAAVSRPDLLGATGSVDLSSRTSVEIGLDAPALAQADAALSVSEPTRWFLRVEDITGTSPAAPRYGVFLNLPDDRPPHAHPERRAGTIASFGIAEASQPDSPNRGQGLTHVFDITGVVSTLRASVGWDAQAVTVTIVPMDLTGEVGDGGDVRAGRISVYAG
jgi:tyrosinase